MWVHCLLPFGLEWGHISSEMSTLAIYVSSFCMSYILLHSNSFGAIGHLVGLPIPYFNLRLPEKFQ